MQERGMVKPFRLNHNGKLVFPSSIFVELDFSIISDTEMMQAIPEAIEEQIITKIPFG